MIESSYELAGQVVATVRFTGLQLERSRLSASEHIRYELRGLIERELNPLFNLSGLTWPG